MAAEQKLLVPSVSLLSKFRTIAASCVVVLCELGVYLLACIFGCRSVRQLPFDFDYG